MAVEYIKCSHYDYHGDPGGWDEDPIPGLIDNHPDSLAFLFENQSSQYHIPTRIVGGSKGGTLLYGVPPVPFPPSAHSYTLKSKVGAYNEYGWVGDISCASVMFPSNPIQNAPGIGKWSVSDGLRYEFTPLLVHNYHTVYTLSTSDFGLSESFRKIPVHVTLQDDTLNIDISVDSTGVIPPNYMLGTERDGSGKVHGFVDIVYPENTASLSDVYVHGPIFDGDSIIAYRFYTNSLPYNFKNYHIDGDYIMKTNSACISGGAGEIVIDCNDLSIKSTEGSQCNIVTITNDPIDGAEWLYHTRFYPYLCKSSSAVRSNDLYADYGLSSYFNSKSEKYAWSVPNIETNAEPPLLIDGSNIDEVIKDKDVFGGAHYIRYSEYKFLWWLIQTHVDTLQNYTIQADIDTDMLTIESFGSYWNPFDRTEFFSNGDFSFGWRSPTNIAESSLSIQSGKLFSLYGIQAPFCGYPLKLCDAEVFATERIEGSVPRGESGIWFSHKGYTKYSMNDSFLMDIKPLYDSIADGSSAGTIVKQINVGDFGEILPKSLMEFNLQTQMSHYTAIIDSAPVYSEEDPSSGVRCINVPNYVTNDLRIGITQGELPFYAIFKVLGPG